MVVPPNVMSHALCSRKLSAVCPSPHDWAASRAGASSSIPGEEGEETAVAMEGAERAEPLADPTDARPVTSDVESS
eukprot:scaffold8014_cov27-Tisochrysis_lutea.AAC.2